MTFGEMLREARERKGMDQTLLGRRAGMSRRHIEEIESGVPWEQPDRNEVVKLAQAVGATVDDTEELLRAAGHLGPTEQLVSRTLEWIWVDPLLTDDQKQLLIAVYRSFRMP